MGRITLIQTIKNIVKLSLRGKSLSQNLYPHLEDNINYKWNPVHSDGF